MEPILAHYATDHAQPTVAAMNRMDAVVVIPVYKAQPTVLEAFALERCAAVLGRYPITFFGPRTLDYSDYLATIPFATIATFDDRWFRSRSTYNRLMLTPDFYETFARYEFLLIHQLDAFVFEDRLEEWCEQPYDYVGAPWPGEYGEWKGVGNGGFSLRRTAACLSVLRSRRGIDSNEYWELLRRSTPNAVVRMLRYYRNVRAGSRSGFDTAWYLRSYLRQRAPEDLFWGLQATCFEPSFRVAPVNVAMSFAVEDGLAQAWPMLRVRPPFGCHRLWYLECLRRYQHGASQPKCDLERKAWQLAEASGVRRKDDRRLDDLVVLGREELRASQEIERL